MKITIEPSPPDGEDEIIIRADKLDNRVLKLITELKTERTRLTGALPDGSITVVDPARVYYFESVDKKVFAYCKSDVIELRSKLYELEEMLTGTDFVRVSKSVIADLSKIRRLAPHLNGRFEAELANGEKIVISRQYVPQLREYFGI